jgi:ubiquinone/menaquinone biosynthesis C-methylase UbiE
VEISCSSGSGAAIDIGHGTLFDSAAREYDLYRPTYPREVIQDAISLSNLSPTSRLLEIGCGTGKATELFASHGYAMDCVDPGRNMVEVAQSRCRRYPRVAFTAQRFEEALFTHRSYRLAFSAQAFHWVERSVRLPKVARLLARHGSLALLYNYPRQPTDELLRRLSRLIQRESGGLLTPWRYEDEVTGWVNEITACGLFEDIRVVRRSWQQRYTANSYAGLFRTYSDFLSLPKVLQSRVGQRIQQVIAKNGGYVCRPYDCVLIHARKRAGSACGKS